MFIVGSARFISRVISRFSVDVSKATNRTKRKGGVMAMTKCRECKKDISTEAHSCPNCGAKSKGKSTFTKIILVPFLGFIILMALASIFGNKNPSTKSDQGNTKQIELDKNREKLFKEMLKNDKFLQTMGIEGYESVGNCLYFKANGNWRALRADGKKQFLSIAYVGWKSMNKNGYIQVRDTFNDKILAEYDSFGIKISQ